MTTLHNPYAKMPSLQVSASLEEYINPMEEESPSSSKDSQESTMASTLLAEWQKKTSQNDEVIEFEEDKPLPPSFHHTIMEETLQDDNCPYVIWATICIPILEKPADPVSTMFEHLKTFITNMLKADAHFSIFLHNLSEYKSLDDLPEPIKDPDQQPANVDEWLEYFPGACPRAHGEYIYTSALLGFREPFPKVVKEMAPWLWKSKCGLCKSSLQLEKPILLGWLLFSTNTMDIDVLWGKISLCIGSIPVGLHWKMICIGTPGSIPPEQQVKALHLYVDKLDVILAKLCLMEVYTSKPMAMHTFPLVHIQMQLVPEIDTILNTKGRDNVDQLWACQNTLLATYLHQNMGDQTFRPL